MGDCGAGEYGPCPECGGYLDLWNSMEGTCPFCFASWDVDDEDEE